MLDFKDTFCRQDVKIRFLGLFDCVNSVGSFEVPCWRSSFPRDATAPADHVRHAVSIDERRSKFRPALFPEKIKGCDIKEVWFPGNHGDVGGGWPRDGKKPLLSDIPLAWMIDEMKNLPDVEKKLEWLPETDQSFHHDPVISPTAARVAVLSEIHDALVPTKGFSWFGVFGWWIIGKP